MQKRVPRALAVALAVLASGTAVALAATRDFDHPASHDTSQQFGFGSVQRQDTPNDPSYDSAEPDDQDGRSSSNFFDEDYRLFGFPSQLTPLARYAAGPNTGKPQIAGVNASGAWKLTRGRPDVVISILDTGIRWEDQGLRTQVHLNRRELPLPRVGKRTCRHYDCNGDGAFTVDDYAKDPRVHNARPTGNDLIQAFSNHVDNDHNGYIDDIAGWDFFDDDNNPFDASSHFAAKDHGSGRAEDAVQRGNDGSGSLGLCPRCQFVPLRIWDTFVSDGDTVGMAMAYSAQNGVSVVEASNGSLYHSRFTEDASAYAYRKGLVQTYSGDDLNTGNHNYPGNYPHALLIQGVVPDTLGLGQSNEIASFAKLPIGTNLPVQTMFRNANTTQYGGKSSVSLVGSTGSQNTGQASGAAALVISAGRDAGVRLTPDEVREILEQTAEDVLPQNTRGLGTADPAQPGWDQHFGYGRVDLGKAVALAESGKVPPEAVIDSPDWYAPLTRNRVRVTGLARARRVPGGRFHWKLEWGAGLEPADGAWHTAREGDASGTKRGFGTLDLAAIRAALAAHTTPADPGGPVFGNAPDPFKQQFAVRLTVTAAGVPTAGVDRRDFTAFTDPTLRKGFPRRLRTGGEAPLRYADLNGDNSAELVLPLEDGTVEALTAKDRELKGWPVRTHVIARAAKHLKALARAHLAAPRDPLRGAAVADLDGDGKPEVIDTAGTRLYVWEPNGTPRKGFPRAVLPRLCGRRWEDQKTKHRKCGFIGSPAVARLDGRGKPPSIVAAALDGHLYAWNGKGRLRKGYPLDLSDPGEPAASRLHTESIGDPAVGDLNGDGRDDVVIASNEAYSKTASSDLTGGLQGGLSDLLANATGGSSRLYAVNGRTGRFLPGWPVKLNGAIQSTLPEIGPGHDAALARIDGKPTVIASTTGGALAEYGADGKRIRAIQQDQYGAQSNATDRTGALNLFEYASVGKVDGKLSVVKYGVSLSQLANLALSGQNLPYNHLIGAYDASTGGPLPAFPTITDDYQFLSSSTIGRVTGAPGAQIIAGTGLGLLHAYDGATGRDVAGFPKQTGGWLYSPAGLASDGRLAAVTREGYLFEWRTGAPSCQTEWPSFRHDARSTGNYDADGTPPARPARPRVVRRGKVYTLSFVAPGDDRFCGDASALRVRVLGRTLRPRLLGPIRGGVRFSVKLTLPRRPRTIAVRALDDVGNVGPTLVVRLRRRV